VFILTYIIQFNPTSVWAGSAVPNILMFSSGFHNGGHVGGLSK